MTTTMTTTRCAGRSSSYGLSGRDSNNQDNKDTSRPPSLTSLDILDAKPTAYPIDDAPDLPVVGVLVIVGVVVIVGGGGRGASGGGFALHRRIVHHLIVVLAHFFEAHAVRRPIEHVPGVR